MELLEGIKVIDWTTAVAGPLSTMFLADMGAEVIKVETPWGDESRAAFYNKGVSPQFQYINRNKKGITLNLKAQKGVEIFKRLTKISDVVVENHVPGTAEKLGISYETLKETNPKIIFASISGYGQYGPYSKRPSYNTMMQADIGFMDLARIDARFSPGVDPSLPPIVIPENIADTIPALQCVIGVLAALNFRNKTGQSQRIDISQMDAMLGVSPSIPVFLSTGKSWREAQETQRGHISGVHKVKDGYVSLAGSGRLEDRLAKLLGVEQVTEKALDEWFKDKTKEEAEKAFVEIGVPIAPVRTLKEVITHPQVKVRGTITEVDHPVAGKVGMPAFPIKFPGQTPKLKRAPELGENNDEVFSKLLDYTKEDIAKLKDEQII